MFDISWLDDSVIRTLLLPWLATYAVHSTLLSAAAWGLSRWTRQRWPALEETLWKGALVGAVLTASLAACWQPVFQWTLSNAAAGGEAVVPASTLAAAETVALPDGMPTASWLAIAALMWATAALAFLVSLAFSWWRLHRRLARRSAITSGPLPAILGELCREAGYRPQVRLTSSVELAVPVAFGLWRREICLPARAAAELSRAELAAAIGHELAHLVRRDPAWRLLARVFEGVFFFQPLHRLAARRLEQLSEDLCDDWTARRTGGVALARCLAEVAGWSLEESRLFPLPGMAVARSDLERRVRRLLGRSADGGPAPRRRFALLVAVALLLTTTWMAPSWSAAPSGDGQEEEQAEARDDEDGEEEPEAEFRERYEEHLRLLEAEVHEREAAFRRQEDELREHEAALRRQFERLRLHEAELREQAELVERQLRDRAEELQQQEEQMREMLRQQEEELRQHHEHLADRARQQEAELFEQARMMEEKARQLEDRGRQQKESAREQARRMYERALELEERAKQQEQQALDRARQLEEQARTLAEEKRAQEKEEKKDRDE